MLKSVVRLVAIFYGQIKTASLILVVRRWQRKENFHRPMNWKQVSTLVNPGESKNADGLLSIS